MLQRLIHIELSQLLFDERDRYGVNFDGSIAGWGDYTMGLAFSVNASETSVMQARDFDDWAGGIRIC